MTQYRLLSKLDILQTIPSVIISKINPAIFHNIGKYLAIKKAFYLSSIEEIEGDYFEFGVFTGSSFCHAVRCAKANERFDDKYGHMYHEKPFSYYKIRFDYRFLGEQTPGGESWNVRNSGIMLHSQSAKSNDLHQDFPVSIEIQLLGGLGKGPRTTGNLCTPGTQVVFNDKLDFTHCISSNSKTYDGDRWVHVEAIILGDQSITHIVEKDTVLVYEAPQITTSYKDEDWDRYGVTSKDYWKKISGKLLSDGYIAIQAESHAIDFKNIELLNLCGCMDKKAKNYKSYFIKEDNSLCKY